MLSNQFLQPLEGRDLLASDWAHVSSGILIVTGTGKADRISVSANDSEVFAKLGRSVLEFEIENVTRVRVNAGPGEDEITNYTRFRATIDGSGGDDTIYGGRGNELLNGGQGNDSLFGGAGDDTLAGGAGDDYLQAGQGDDRMLVDSSDDFLVGGAGPRDVVDFSGAVAALKIGPTFDSTPNQLGYQIGTGQSSTARMDMESIEIIRATDHNDSLFLNESLTIPARGLEVECGGGNDEVYYNHVRLTVFGQSGNDRVWPTRFQDGRASVVLYGGPGNDSLFASIEQDTIDGGSGNDSIWSDAGRDLLIGGKGDDQFFSWPGGDGDRDTIDGGSGIDSIEFYPDDTANLLRSVEDQKPK